MQLWTNINTIIDSLTNTVVALARTTEKTVVLVENEVDGLSVAQKSRIEQERKEFNALLKGKDNESHT